MNKQFIFKKAQKIKLIEILLIVGSLIAAFKLPTNMVWVFMLFAICSIIYYIFIQTPIRKHSIMMPLSACVSFTFVAIVTSHLIVSLIESSPQEYALLNIIIGISYYAVLGPLLTIILARNE